MTDPEPWIAQVSKIVPLHLSEAVPVRVGVKTIDEVQSRPVFSMHFEVEISVMLRGAKRIVHEGGERIYRAGEARFSGIWEPHGGQAVSAPCQELLILLWPPMLARLAFEEAPHVDWLGSFQLPFLERPPRPVGYEEEMEILVGRLLDWVSRGRPESARPRLYVLALLELFARRQSSPTGRENSTPLFNSIGPAINLVFKSRRLVTGAEAARACGMSRGHFCRVFQKAMQVSFGQFALRYRVHGAAEQIAGTDLAVKTVSGEWGFSDPSHLHHLMQRYYGCTPTDYRKQRQESP
ncbi:helix-turn-helix transcriptional regulator [bacterium]|nr:helix-turn-helix transcriptional regulator [bacterium]